MILYKISLDFFLDPEEACFPLTRGCFSAAEPCSGGFPVQPECPTRATPCVSHISTANGPACVETR